MKQCVSCRMLYADGNLRFCRFDGSRLNEVAPRSEDVTILFSTGQLNNRIQPLEELRRKSDSGKLSK